VPRIQYKQSIFSSKRALARRLFCRLSHSVAL